MKHGIRAKEQNLQDNSVFHGLLPDLIIPAVQNTEEPALRDQGLICLGLCCMIDAVCSSFLPNCQADEIENGIKLIRIVCPAALGCR
jgi:condensin complex subunit 3